MGVKKRPLRIGELAKETGVSPDTLRHYERVGVLPAPRRSRNGYREYPAQALDRVRLVRGALAIGFTLDELARLLAERDRGGAPCHEVRALAEEKLDHLERWLAELTAARDRLRLLLAEWDGRLARTPAHRRAGLLQALAIRGDTPSDPVRTPLRRRRGARKESGS